MFSKNMLAIKKINLKTWLSKIAEINQSLCELLNCPSILLGDSQGKHKEINTYCMCKMITALAKK